VAHHLRSRAAHRRREPRFLRRAHASPSLVARLTSFRALSYSLHSSPTRQHQPRGRSSAGRAHDWQSLVRKPKTYSLLSTTYEQCGDLTKLQSSAQKFAIAINLIMK
jgi:hypothetical protein